MATVIRGPLIVGRADVPIQRAVIFSAPSLLATTLAIAGAIPLPVSAAHSFPNQQQLRAPGNYLNADTSRGTPKTLLAEVATPPLARHGPTTPGHWANEFLNSDTTQDLPNTLRPVGAAPVPPPPVKQYTAPDPRLVLQGRFDVPPNVVLDFPADLYAAGQLTDSIPVIQPGRLNADTSAGAFAAQRTVAVVVPPVVNLPGYAIERPRYSEDTSQSVPKALYGDATSPFRNLQQTAPDRVRPVADTSQSAATYQVVQPPFANAPVYTVDWLRLVTNTSAGTPKPLIADGQPPLFNAPQFQVYPKPPVVNTSIGTNVALTTAIPPPPFFQTDWPAPIEYRSQQQLHSWDQQANPAFIPDFVPTSQGIGGGGRPKRRYQIKLGERILEGSQEQIEALAREIALSEPATPDVVEIVVPAKKRKPALIAKTQVAADVLAAFTKAVADEQMRLQEIEDEEALIALLT